MIDKNFLLEGVKVAAYEEVIKMGYTPRFAEIFCAEAMKNGLFEKHLNLKLKAANVKTK